MINVPLDENYAGVSFPLKPVGRYQKYAAALIEA
jgi:hypothetical protein